MKIQFCTKKIMISNAAIVKLVFACGVTMDKVYVDR